MKNIKKIFSVLLTLVISLCMIDKVSASTCKITVNGTTEGKTYEIYKIFDLTHNGDKVSYTIAPNWINFFIKEGLGEEYITSTYKEGLNQIMVNTKLKGEATQNPEPDYYQYYIEITESNKKAFTEDALEYIARNEIEPTASKNGEKDKTSLEFTGLDLGYYLVYPKGATDIKEGQQTICSLDSTMPNATVNVKATYPTIHKEADDESVDVGQLVKFTIAGKKEEGQEEIKVKVPTTTGYTKYKYIISDTWSAGLEYPTETEFNFQVKFGETTINVKPTLTKVTGTETINGFTLEFDMTKYQAYAGQDIVITYNLRVTKDAIIAGTTNEPTHNSVTLTYSNNPKDAEETLTTPPVIVKLYSSEIIIDKYDAENKSTKLSGAKFVLSKVKQDGTTVYYRALDALTDGNLITSKEATSTTAEVLVSTTAGVKLVEWTENINEATVLTTDSNGKAEFEGIENGTYQLVETEAPDGYNKLARPETVVIEEKDNKKSISMISEIANHTGNELPETGGFGTKMFIMIGSLLAVASAIILVTNKRMSKEFM